MICKNFIYNILLKVFNTDYFINYFNRNINIIFEIYYNYNYKKTKKKYKTCITSKYRNFIIFYLNKNDNNQISNLISINYKIIKLIKLYFSNTNFNINRNYKIDNYYIQETYNDNYHIIYKKIDKIIKSIKINI